MYKIPANTVFVGKNLVFMPECHSTNTIALQLCQELPPAADGTVVVTANQTAGRGQRGNSWRVEAGKNLTFSIVLNTGFLAVRDQFYLNVFASLAIKGYLEEKGCKAISIKWPNDIYIGANKIGGILVENQLSGNRITKSIVGIGLNINQRQFEFEGATSLSLEMAQEFSLAFELDLLLPVIEATYLQLRSSNLAGLMNAYLKSMYWIDAMHTFSSRGVTFDGCIRGVDPSGKLIVTVNEADAFFDVREISYLR